MFVLRERKRQNEQGRGRERGEERERIPSRLHTVSAEPNAGLKLTNREIMSCTDTKSLLTD